MEEHTHSTGCLPNYRDRWETIEQNIKLVLGTKDLQESIQYCEDWSHFLSQVVQLRRKMYAWKCQQLCTGCKNHSLSYDQHYGEENSCLYGNYPYMMLTCQPVTEKEMEVLSKLNQAEMAWKLSYLNEKRNNWRNWYCEGCIQNELAQEHHTCLQPFTKLTPIQLSNKDRQHSMLFARMMEKEPIHDFKCARESSSPREELDDYTPRTLSLKIPKPTLKRYASVVETENVKNQCVEAEKETL